MALGDIIYRHTSLWKRLVGNTTTTPMYLRQTGTGAASAAPAWTTLALGDAAATVTLTDAQVKALPSTPITLVAAPGSGFALELIQARISTGITGAYTNINAAAYLVIRMSGGDEHSSYIANDAGEGLTQATDLLTNAQSSATLTKFQTTVDPAAGWGALSSYYGSAYENQGLQILADNGGSGAFTGGNAANVFKVRIWYAVVPVP